MRAKDLTNVRTFQLGRGVSGRGVDRRVWQWNVVQ